MNIVEVCVKLYTRGNVSFFFKGYLEELLRMREHQLQDLQRKHQNLLNVFRKFDDDAKKDRQQMENVVIELQQQL